MELYSSTYFGHLLLNPYFDTNITWDFKYCIELTIKYGITHKNYSYMYKTCLMHMLCGHIMMKFSLKQPASKLIGQALVD